MKRFLLFAGLIVFLGAQVNAQVEVNLVSSVSSATQGVYYNLPKTTIYVDVEVCKTTITPGEYAIYAEQFLKLKEVPVEVQMKYSLKGVTVHWISEPDPNALYLITAPKNKPLPMLNFTSNGLLQSVNIAPDSYIPNTLPLLGSGKVLSNLTSDPKDLMGEEFLASGSTIKMAEIVAKKIISIRETRAEVLAGEAENMPKDGEAMKFVVATLGEQEQALLTLFSGVHKMETLYYRFALTPKSVEDKQVVFRFSDLFGVVGANDLSGYPVVASFAAAPPKPLVLLTPKEEKKNDKKGLVYINPAQIDFSLKTPEKELYKGQFSMTQFGQIGVLPSWLFSSSKKMQVKMDPALGRIVELKREP